MTVAIRWPDRPLRSLMPKQEPRRLLAKTEPNGKKGLQLDPNLFWLPGSPTDQTYDYPQIRGLTAYKLSALAFACMSFRATKLTEPPLWVTEEIDGEEEWLETKDVDADLARLLEEPNPDMDMHELFEFVSLYLDGTGRSLLVKSRDRGKRIGALYPFAGDQFQVEPADGLAYGKFTVQTAKGSKVYGPEDVIFWKNTDPRNLSDGLAPLDVALGSINIDEDMRQAVKAMLRNKMRPGGIALFPNGQDDGAWLRNKEEAAANYAGVHNAGKLMSLEGAVDLKFIESSLKDLALGPISENAEASVCSAFKIHPAIVGALIGIVHNSGFADTIAPATDLFYDVVVIPTWTRFEKKLTKSLLREIDPNPLRFIRFDKSDVKALQDDLLARAQEAEAASTIWTRDERRIHTGKPALDNDPRGNEIEGAAGEPTGLPEPNKRARPVRTEHKADARQRLWRKFDIKASREESRYEAEANAQFAKERDEILKRFEGTTEARLQDALDSLRNSYTRKDGKYHLEWVERYLGLIEKTFDAAGSDLGAELGFDFDLTNPRVQSAIKRRVNKLAGNVSDTTYGKIKDAVSEARANGEGIPAIAKRIRDDVFGGEITKARATAIARTETVGALNEGEVVAARESGVIVTKEWMTQSDSRVRDSHAEIDGEKVGLEEPFGNGLMYPGDQSGDASEVVNCRCTLLYHSEEAA